MGTGNETDIVAAANATPPASSPAMILNTLKVDTANADATIDSLRQYWKSQNMQGEAPGYQPEAQQTLKAVVNNLDPASATFVGRGNQPLPDTVKRYSYRVGATAGGRVVGATYPDGNGNTAIWEPVDPNNPNNPDNWQIGE